MIVPYSFDSAPPSNKRPLRISIRPLNKRTPTSQSSVTGAYRIFDIIITKENDEDVDLEKDIV